MDNKKMGNKEDVLASLVPYLTTEQLKQPVELSPENEARVRKLIEGWMRQQRHYSKTGEMLTLQELEELERQK